MLDRRGEPGEKAKYLVKWKGYGREHNVWYPIHALTKAQNLIDECNARIAADPTRNRRQKAPQQKAPQQGPSSAMMPSQPGTQPKQRGRPRKDASKASTKHVTVSSKLLTNPSTSTNPAVNSTKAATNSTKAATNPTKAATNPAELLPTRRSMRLLTQ